MVEVYDERICNIISVLSFPSSYHIQCGDRNAALSVDLRLSNLYLVSLLQMC
jgi:hypothetical protein